MDQPIRLMTANLLVDRADIAYLGYALDVIQPDLFAIQELGHKAADLIASRFAHHDLRPKLDSRGRGIASMFSARFGEIPLPWRAGLWAEIEHGPQRWILANVHMRNPIVLPWWRSVRLRAGQVEALFNWSEGQPEGQPIVLAGDMNASPAWPVYRRLAGRWDDLAARSASDSGGRPAPTWAWRPGWPRLLRIDHVFGTGAQAVSTQVVPLRGSDHAAVVVDLVFESADS
jgi:hypothetical protein